MTLRNEERPGAAGRPSEKLRVAAARLRVESDAQVRRPTPDWIKELARKSDPRSRKP